VKDNNNFTFNAEDPQIRVPSARSARICGNKRANPAGRLPDDTWIVRPAADDSWVLRPAGFAGRFFSRPTTRGTTLAWPALSKNAQGFHGCQMPEQFARPASFRVSSNPGDIVLDPFAG